MQINVNILGLDDPVGPFQPCDSTILNTKISAVVN